MTDKTRIKIAAAVTALFLAGLSAAGLAARNDAPQAAIGSAAAPTAQQTPTSLEAPGAVPDTEPSTYEGESYDDDGYEAERGDDDGYDDDG
jgi:hypothetical protein